MNNLQRAARPGSYMADAFPIFRRLPDILAPWRVEARRMGKLQTDLWVEYLAELKEKMKTMTGAVTECYAGSYLEKRADSGYENAPGCGLTENGFLRDTTLGYVAGSILQAGADTTASTMETFILFMMSNPVALEKARKEIDEVVGVDRMPTWEDEVRLPYVVACIKETLRRRPTLTMSVPHSNDEDDTYQGYFIPKGSTIISNVWAIQMDPDRYPHPTEFNPDRFFVKGQPTQWAGGPDVNNRDQYIFGWGRRFCQGSYIAEASLFIVLTRILWGINFFPPVDPETGDPVIPDVMDEEGTFMGGLILGPRPFRVGFKARTEKHEYLIRKAFDDVQLEWQSVGLPGDERRS